MEELDVGECPNCGEDLNRVEEESTFSDEGFPPYPSDDGELIDEHTDVFLECGCGFYRHLTKIRGEIVSAGGQ